MPWKNTPCGADAPTQPPAPLHTTTGCLLPPVPTRSLIASSAPVRWPTPGPQATHRRAVPRRLNDAAVAVTGTVTAVAVVVSSTGAHPDPLHPAPTTGKILLTVNQSPAWRLLPEGGPRGPQGDGAAPGPGAIRVVERMRLRRGRGPPRLLHLRASARGHTPPSARGPPLPHPPPALPHRCAAARPAARVPGRQAYSRIPPPHTPFRLPIFLLSRPTSSLASGLF